MKLFVIAVLTFAIVSASADVAQLIKNTKHSLGDYDAISIEGETTSPTGVDSSFYLRFDEGNNIFSYTLGFVDTAFGKFTNLTYAWNFNTEKSYIHTTGDDFCMDDEFERPYGSDYQTFAQWAMDFYTDHSTREYTKIDGVMHVIEHTLYNEENDIYITAPEETYDADRVYGIFQGDDLDVKVTKVDFQATFTVADHIPSACP
ncbi:unnamed protein product [Moneuplotes crassus]|uniref:Uncharacterized protein n=1 Tax=Euplotes crassus TaxID=5936 RepID=A0AAD1XUV5_EUPCR|nr:unnamed protein product [Moneuplotes crassus]